MKSIKMTDHCEGKQTLGELWENISRLCSGVVEDNKEYRGKYPERVRFLQVVSIKAMISEIEELSKAG